METITITTTIQLPALPADCAPMTALACALEQQFECCASLMDRGITVEGIGQRWAPRIASGDPHFATWRLSGAGLDEWVATALRRIETETERSYARAAGLPADFPQVTHSGGAVEVTLTPIPPRVHDFGRRPAAYHPEADRLARVFLATP